MKINKRTRVWPIFYIKAETGLVKEAIFGRTEVLNKKSYTKYIGSFRWLRKRWIVRWNGPSRPFSFIFGLFKQTMQQIYVKIAHPEWSEFSSEKHKIWIYLSHCCSKYLGNHNIIIWNYFKGLLYCHCHHSTFIAI